jgi:hypothetical protein
MCTKKNTSNPEIQEATIADHVSDQNQHVEDHDGLRNTLGGFVYSKSEFGDPAKMNEPKAVYSG